MMYHVGVFLSILLGYWVPRLLVYNKEIPKQMWIPELISQLFFLCTILALGIWFGSPPNGSLLKGLSYATNEFFIIVAPSMALVISMICYILDGVQLCRHTIAENKTYVKNILVHSIQFLSILPIFAFINLLGILF